MEQILKLTLGGGSSPSSDESNIAQLLLNRTPIVLHNRPSNLNRKPSVAQREIRRQPDESPRKTDVWPYLGGLLGLSVAGGHPRGLLTGS